MSRMHALVAAGRSSHRLVLLVVAVALFTAGPAGPAQAQSPASGPGGPILVITTPANPFSQYFAEILRAEGLNEFALRDVSTVTAATLAPYDVAILGDMTLSPAQVAMLSDVGQRRRQPHRQPS